MYLGETHTHIHTHRPTHIYIEVLIGVIKNASHDVPVGAWCTMHKLTSRFEILETETETERSEREEREKREKRGRERESEREERGGWVGV